MKPAATIPIPQAIAECLFLCYISMRNGQEYARAIYQDKEAHPVLIKEFLRVSAGLTNVMAILDNRVPKEIRQDFNEQLKNTDHLRLDNIKSLYARMTPKEQDLLELAAESIIRKEFEVAEN